MRSSGSSPWLVAAMLTLAVARRPALAGEVTLRNGDHITGTVLSLARGELTLASDGAGKLTIKVKMLKTFSTDAPLIIRLVTGASFESRIAEGPDGKVEVQRSPRAAPELVAILDITALDPLASPWTGSLLLNGEITGGNSKTTEAGIDLTLDKKWRSDRLHLTGEYDHGRERAGETGTTSTTTDFGEAYGKAEHDVHDRVYINVNAKVLHDAVADLPYRVSPAAGIGYRWSDTPALLLFTDVGVSYSEQRFASVAGRSFWGPQLEYGLQWEPVNRLKLSNTVEFYPSISDIGGNYFLDAHAGIKVMLSAHAFVELRGEYDHDTHPAPGARRGEYHLVLGPGWKQ